MSLDRLERRRSVSASRPACAHVLHVHVANHRANCGHQTRRPLARVRPIVNVSWAGAALAYDRGRDIIGRVSASVYDATTVLCAHGSWYESYTSHTNRWFGRSRPWRAPGARRTSSFSSNLGEVRLRRYYDTPTLHPNPYMSMLRVLVAPHSQGASLRKQDLYGLP